MRILVVLAMALVIALSPKGTEPEFMQVWATAEDTTTFLITEGQQEGNLYSIYDDELEQGEQYLLTIDDKGTEDPTDDEILDYIDLETWELEQQ